MWVYKTGPEVGEEIKLSGFPYERPVILEVLKFTLWNPPLFSHVTVSPTLILKFDGV